MHDAPIRIYSAFDGDDRIASGPLAEVLPVCRRALSRPAPGPVLLFDDTTGRTVDIDPREPGRPATASAGESIAAEADQALVLGGAPRGRGRPKLGVVAREVTLLPRHWDWLASQSGGASVVLRKLVDQARRSDTDDARQRNERAFHFMSVLAGNRPGFEEAIRALFANDLARLREQMADWPEDVRDHALRLATGEAGLREAAEAACRCDATPGNRGVTA